MKRPTYNGPPFRSNISADISPVLEVAEDLLNVVQVFI